MTTTSIFRGFVLLGPAIKWEQPRQKKQAIAVRQNSRAVDEVNWSHWFAILSPIIGVLLGVIGAFLIEH